MNNEKLYYSKYIKLLKLMGMINNNSFYVKKLSFNEFVKYIVNNKNINIFDKIILNTQSSYVQNKNNKIYCKIGKYETLNEDLSKILNQEINLPKLNSTNNKKHWTKYYNKETKYLVYNYYKKDFINFNYKKDF